MMDHVKLFIVLGVLLVGAATSAYLYQAYKRYASPPLKPIVFHVVFYNLLVLLLFVDKYYEVNIGGGVFSIPDDLRHVSVNLLIYLFLIGFSYASLKIYLGFMQKKIARTRVRWIAVGTILLVAGICTEPLFTRESLAWKIHFHFYDNVGVVFLLLEIGVMIALPIKAGGFKDPERARLVRSFSYLYISRYPVIALVLIVPQPLRLLLGLLYPNVVPYLWYRFFLLPYIKNTMTRAAQKTDLAGIAERYRLSPREAEILGCILAGKSNRDIEESLFISYHTVKNHVYSVYRKLGVKTRFELLHRLGGGGTGEGRP